MGPSPFAGEEAGVSLGEGEFVPSSVCPVHPANKEIKTDIAIVKAILLRVFIRKVYVRAVVPDSSARYVDTANSRDFFGVSACHRVKRAMGLGPLAWGLDPWHVLGHSMF